MRIFLTLNASLLPLLLSADAIAVPDTNTPADSLEKTLQEIVVTAGQPETRLEGTTLISTIAGSPLADVGTALDVLKQLPMITVNGDGVVEVAGKGVPEIFIDGRPMSDESQMEQLISDNIQKVELTLAPGALYSADTPAVLKITTRRNLADGLSVTDMAMVKKRRRWSANNILGLNYHIGAWDLFANFTAGHYSNLIKGTTTNTLEHDGHIIEIGSSQHNSAPTTVGVIKAGANYSDGSLSAGAYYRFNPERGRLANHGSEWITGEAPICRSLFRDIDARSHLVSAYADYRFGNGVRLHFDGDIRTATSQSGVSAIFPDGEATDVSSHSDRSNHLAAGKLYAVAPLFQGELTGGLQGTHTRTKLDFTMTDPNVAEYIPSMLTVTRQTVTSAFASWSRMFGSLSLDAGVRYEYVDYNLSSGTASTSIRRKDHRITPDISLGYSFTDNSSLTLSYKTSTVRPPYSQLTGSLEYVGRHEIEGGNPALRDERMHDLQLFGTWHGFILQADWRRSLDSYGFVKRPYDAPTLQLMLQPVNMNVTLLGIFLSWSHTIKKWTPSITTGMQRQWLHLGNSSYNGQLFSYYIDNTFTLPADILVTANAYGQSAGPIQTNRFSATPFSLSLSVGKHFFNKALQVKLEATDIFNSINNGWTMHTFGVNVVKHQSYDRRGISLTLSYRLRPRRNNYKGTSASQEELDRL